jgi:hypothetical protein
MDEHRDERTGPGEAVDKAMPEPEQQPGGTLGRDEGEGAPGPKDPGTTRKVTGAD